ncbi:MAG: hypothetical protein QNJ31_08695 [Candidatus Caenarcaniphilales bacterium]|nr:hypothetical protein [Candidatus Caenarcaniphilales bacterium]
MFLKAFSEKCGEPNNIWIGGTENLHFIKDLEKGDLYRVKGIKQSHIKNAILKNGLIWVNTHNGLYYIKPSNPERAQRIEGLEETIIVKIYFSGKQILALDWKRNLFQVDIQSNKAIPVEKINNISTFKITDSINTDNKETTKENIWILGGEEGGLSLIKKNDLTDIQNLEPLKGVQISSLKELNGFVWALTKTDGLFRIDPENLLVKQLKPTKKQAITKLIKANEKLLAGTLNNGAYIFEADDLSKLVKVEFLENEMINLIAESPQYIWIVGDFNGDIVRINKQNPLDVAKTSSLQGEKVIDIKPFNNYLWILTSKGEVYKINQDNLRKLFKVELLNKKQVTKIKHLKNNLFFESFHGAFFATEDNTVQPIKNLENKRINSIYPKDGQLWVETYDHKVFRINPNLVEIANYLKDLDGINIWNIVEKKGNYIIASNNGAFIIHKDNLNEAILIPNTKDHKVTSLLIYCDSLLLGTLEGYQRYLLKDLLKN